MKKLKLTPAIRQHIVSSVRAGAYPHVAARAWGVPEEVLHDWIARGERARAREPYSSFAAELRRAQAEARTVAETTLFQQDPKVWLEHGPGREQTGVPGWTSAVRPLEIQPPAAPENALLSAAFMGLAHRVLDALTAYPEARRSVAAALTGVLPITETLVDPVRVAA